MEFLYFSFFVLWCVGNMILMALLVVIPIYKSWNNISHGWDIIDHGLFVSNICIAACAWNLIGLVNWLVMFKLMGKP